MATLPGSSRQAGRQVAHDHEGFLRHRSFRWLKIAGGLSLLCILSYLLIDVEPRHNGGMAIPLARWGRG
jgi:hypothetical protein